MEVIYNLLIKELINYKYYKKVLAFVKKKKYYNIDIDYNWYENYILNMLSQDELKILLRNVFSYNKHSNETYYVPIELEKIPYYKIYKWISYNLYFKSLWQLNKEQRD